MTEIFKHHAGQPLREFVRFIIEKNYKETELYGIVIKVESTVNKTMRGYYCSEEHQARVKKLGYKGHPLFAPYANTPQPKDLYALLTLHND